MIQRKSQLTALLALFLLLSGCAGVRNSYESLLDSDAAPPLIVLEVGEQREILAVGDGFPGWWGYYPSAASLNPEVARVTFKKGRSLIPFREPGIIFGGSRCYLHGNKKGSTWLLFGNAHTLPEESIEIDGTMVPERHDLPGYKWVKVEVVPAPDL